MATFEGSPSRWKGTRFQRSLGASRAVAQAILSLTDKEPQKRWPTFPMGLRSKGTFRSASSYLLHQLIHRSHEAEVEQEEQQEEGESEESEESEMQNLEDEYDGVLREENVADALDGLGWSGRGTEQVYRNLNLSHCELIDVSILSGYVHLQKLNLSGNRIEDLSCVSCMPYLLELNASQNRLTTFFNFKPPQNLKQKVDFSSNQISEMYDLSAYHTLTQLILDNNEIEEITGLEKCISLTHLSLAGNRITTIKGLGTLPIKVLSVSNNQIETITGLEELKALQNLDLSHNQISSLHGLENHDLLEVINLEDNKIKELSEIEYIENLPILRVLNLLRNPIQTKPEYWFFVIFMLLRLTELDQQKIKVEEKVYAVNKYDPPPEVVAAQDHMTHVVNSMSQPQRIFDSTLPSLDAPYPMLILTGPEACGKRELAHRLCRQFSTYFRYGACHTTRPPYFGEGDRVDYHFVSQEVFDEMLSMGKFILTFNYGNHNYGLNRDTVEGIARDGLASCIHMELEGIRSLKYSYFEPRYILVVPMDKEKYEGYLRRKGLFSRAEIEIAVSRVDLYVKVNRKFPGYFDAVINADDLDIAYQKLSELIREYLGLTETAKKGLAPTADTKTSYVKSEDYSRKSSTVELSDSTDRNYFTKLWAKLSSKKSPVERESLQRQHETARQALMGKTPRDHTLLFQRGPVPIPTVSGHQYFATIDELQKTFELCEDHVKAPFGPYPETSKDSNISQRYSTLFQTCPWFKELPFQLPEGGVSSRPGSAGSDLEVDGALKGGKHGGSQSCYSQRHTGTLKGCSAQSCHSRRNNGPRVSQRTQ
ncbi:leucine-rich repeat and guanylate kinase domain-containing protein isoform X4 [Rattus norvegicus]|uniref:leucine-rich repeat and guanylate kinase domain-containing protein isoform X4 n=1 Tax=Rattus norvegicus TaxID=10116 RepID=UPI0003D0AC8E|nr:leucine-rich repeat and guanylate kinase domain-containing protein isoform X4 [Rattus norvegicus]|eukprot:XP_017448019.1 PREDICTED: leucine-rich repeat and guanylate kinase domain-containing protein isoform X6 [Rattus norvegicus]